MACIAILFALLLMLGRKDPETVQRDGGVRIRGTKAPELVADSRKTLPSAAKKEGKETQTSDDHPSKLDKNPSATDKSQSEETQPVSTLQLIVPKRTLVFLDGKSLGKINAKILDLVPGKHKIRAKIGKRWMTRGFISQANTAYEMRFHPNLKKPQFKKKNPKKAKP